MGQNVFKPDAKFERRLLKTEKKYYTNELIKKYNLKPFEIDLDTLDLGSDFISHLIKTLDSGWEAERPLLYSVPVEPRLPNADDLRGHIIDGRHRVVAWGQRYRAGMPVPDPVLKAIPVTSTDNIVCLRAHYEALNRSKDQGTINRHISKILLGMLEVHPELDTLEKAWVFFKKNGFVTKALTERAYDKFQVKKNQTLAKPRPKRIGAKDIFHKAFGDRMVIQSPIPVDDNATSIRLVCSACKEDLLCPKCQASYAMLIQNDHKIGYKTELKKLVKPTIGEAKRIE